MASFKKKKKCSQSFALLRRNDLGSRPPKKKPRKPSLQVETVDTKGGQVILGAGLIFGRRLLKNGILISSVPSTFLPAGVFVAM